MCGADGGASRKGSWASVPRLRGEPAPGLGGAGAVTGPLLDVVMITGGGVVRRRKGMVVAEARPGWRLAGAVGGAPPMRGLRVPPRGVVAVGGDLLKAAAVPVDVPRGVTALRVPAARWGPMLSRGTAADAPDPSDLERPVSTGVDVASGDAGSRGGIHDASRLVRHDMADGGALLKPPPSGESAAGGEGEAEGPATLPAPAPYVANGVESSLKGSSLLAKGELNGARASLSDTRCRRDVLRVP